MVAICIHDSCNNKKYVIMYSLVLHMFGSVHLIKYNYRYNVTYYVKYKSRRISIEISNNMLFRRLNYLCNTILLIILIVVIIRH